LEECRGTNWAAAVAVAVAVACGKRECAEGDGAREREVREVAFPTDSKSRYTYLP
jgi:hypothetical protein